MASQRQPVGRNINQFSHFGQATSPPPQTREAGDSERPELTLAPVHAPVDELAEELIGTAAQEDEDEDEREHRQRRAPRPRHRGVRRADLMLPDRVMADLRELGRPERTGAPRTIGAKFFAAAYVRAVHELIGDHLNTSGLDGHLEDEAVQRVKQALLALDS